MAIASCWPSRVLVDPFDVGQITAAHFVFKNSKAPPNFVVVWAMGCCDAYRMSGCVHSEVFVISGRSKN